MDSFANRLMQRPRPAKYSFGQALATAAAGGAAYFGEAALAKKNAEALEESRRYDAAEWDRRTAAGDEIADQNAVDAEARAIERYRLQQGDESALRDETIAGRVVTPDEEGVVREYGINHRGERVADLGVDPDYVVGPDGTSQRLSAGGRGGAPTEGQAKFDLQSTILDDALGEMNSIIESGFDLRSGTALYDQIIGKFGDIGRWMQTDAGQRFMAARTSAGEALFKGQSGAAGSDAEAQRFYSMLPSPGDKPDTIEMKNQLMDRIISAMQEAAGNGADRDQTVLYTRAMARRAARELGFDLNSGQSSRTADGYMQGTPGVVTQDGLGLTEDDLRYINQ